MLAGAGQGETEGRGLACTNIHGGPVGQAISALGRPSGQASTEQSKEKGGRDSLPASDAPRAVPFPAYLDHVTTSGFPQAVQDL